MDILGELKKVTQLHWHGGRTVLRVIAQLPEGDSNAAKHTRALVRLLQQYAKRVLYPAAAAELEATAPEQKYRFSAHRYEILVTQRPQKRSISLLLTTLYTTQTGAKKQQLLMLWEPSGTHQLRPKRLYTRAYYK